MGKEVLTKLYSEGNEHCLSYELESYLISSEATELSNLSRIAAGSGAEKWCAVVSAICQRFLSFLAQETHLKEWACVLKKDAEKLMKLQQEANEARESSANLIKIIEDEKKSMAKERESLVLQELQLDDCKKAVAESEKQIAVSLAEAQRKSEELCLEKALIEEKRQQVNALEEQVKKTLQDVQLETDNLNKQKLVLQNQQSQALEKEKSLETQWLEVNNESDKLKQEWEKLNEERMLDKKEKKATKDMREQLAAKEDMLRCFEKELEEKCIAVENLARKLNAREKLLKNIKKQYDDERTQLNEIMANLDVERNSTEERKAEIEALRGTVEAARESLAKDMESADERMKEWENRIKQQEDEVLQKQELLERLEVQVRTEQEHFHVLHNKVQKEQEKMAEELKKQENNLRQHESILEKKDEDLRKHMQKLVEKRNVLDIKLKQLKEIEIRTESLEKELHKRHEEHLMKVESHAKDYKSQMEQLETIRHDLHQKNVDIDRRFQEVRALKKEVKLWQKDAEKNMNKKLEELLKERSGLEVEKQNLKNLQIEVQKATTKLMDDILGFEHASKKLDTFRRKIDVSQNMLEMVTDHFLKQSKFMREREVGLKAKEQHVETLQCDLEQRIKALFNKETELRLKEQALNLSTDGFKSEKSSGSKDNQQMSDSTLNIHFKITEEKLEVSKNLQFPSAVRKEQNTDLHSQGEGKVREASQDASDLEILQQEFVKILKERESLKAQQHKLEETKNEVRDAKLMLAAQLQATKDMVVEASITAQKASREREALERERRLLGRAQKEMEFALSSRKVKVSLEEKLQDERRLMEEEKEPGMCVINNSGQMRRQYVDTVETHGRSINGPERPGQVSSTATVAGAASHSFSDHDVRIQHDLPTAQIMHPSLHFDLNMINLWRENECAKIEREEKMILNKISRLHNQLQEDVNQAGLQDVSNDLEVTSFPTAMRHDSNNYNLFQRDLGPSLEALQMPVQSSDTHRHDIYRESLDEASEGFLSENEGTVLRDGKQCHEVDDHVQENNDICFHEANPNQNRLESMMQSLVTARQASRGRLQRTKALLQSIPLAGRSLVMAEVQQALCALTDRLQLMEQMEDELADELREAYQKALPDSEGILVDKVELLCKMEDQQTLRAEWEEDMQCQLEKVSVLQATSQRSSSCFSTPVKRTVFDRIVSSPSTNQSIR
ncbi:hypothetical protein KP509_32G028600 [Ceratopteris richardii]|uniref:Uncharacterized protein n=1 Tax=Ceratopteris richardii TaxID=49495 RepID=A0A8T2QSP7_CERRI|nr:hypothetical protein KP509_32G028600 [Ceratopteris richardii]